MAKSEDSLLEKIKQELNEKLEPSLLPLFGQRDGAARLAQSLPRIYLPDKTIEGSSECRAWELAGLHFLSRGRPHEALPIFASLYDHMLAGQERRERIHKGLPLVRIYECYLMMGFVALPKRFLMLTLIEDAIRGNGSISAETSGVYFRLVWRHGLVDSELQRYAAQTYDRYIAHPTEALFPESILQDFDKDWMEFPTQQEAAVYSANPKYIRHLINQLGDASGENLERLAAYILESMPGCRTTRRIRSPSTDYDIVCSLDGPEVDFRSEFGRYFVCECKD
jgi:hypothetical protein